MAVFFYLSETIARRNIRRDFKTITQAAINPTILVHKIIIELYYTIAFYTVVIYLQCNYISTKIKISQIISYL